MSLCVAYLVNQYPRTSHTFIRREIAALERLGVRVARFSVRGSPEALTNPEDLAEQDKTLRLLDHKALLVVATLLAVVFRPLKFVRALGAAWRLARGAPREFGKSLAYLAEACLLRRNLARVGAGHLHAHFGTNPTSVALLCHVLGGPSYSFTVHGPEEFDRPDALLLPEKIARAAFVVGVSSFGKSQLMRWARPEDWDKIAVVRCGVDEAWFEGTREVDAGSRRLLSVGRLSGQKGQHILVAAAAELQKTHEFELRIIGDGELRASLEKAIAKSRVGDRIELLGWANEATIRSELDQARAFVLPSFAEGLPVALMEGMARRRPAIVTYIAGMPELLTTDAGWLVPAGAVEDLARAMAEALDAAAGSLDDKGRVGAERARRMHSSHDNAKLLLERILAVHPDAETARTPASASSTGA